FFCRSTSLQSRSDAEAIATRLRAEMNVADVIVLGGVDPGRSDGKTQVGAGSFGEAIHRVMRDMDLEIEEIAFRGDPDRDFLAMMIPHDKAAVKMARLVLLHGRDPMVRQLAE